MSRSREAPALFDVVEPALADGWPKSGFGAVSELIDRLPEPSSLRPGVWLGVGEGTSGSTNLSKLFRRKTSAHLAVRCAALLAKGFERVGAGVTEDGRELAWGRVPE